MNNTLGAGYTSCYKMLVEPRQGRFKLICCPQHDEALSCWRRTGRGDVECLRLDVDTLGEDTNTCRDDRDGTGSIANTGEAKRRGGNKVSDGGAWAAIVCKEDWRVDQGLGHQNLSDNVTKVALPELLEALRLHTKHCQEVTALRMR